MAASDAMLVSVQWWAFEVTVAPVALVTVILPTRSNWRFQPLTALPELFVMVAVSAYVLPVSAVLVMVTDTVPPPGVVAVTGALGGDSWPAASSAVTVNACVLPAASPLTVA